MSDVINLRIARKAKMREEAAAKAAQNRVAHGRSKAEQQAATSEIARRDAALDALKRDR